jgi:helix-turn-helix protein
MRTAMLHAGRPAHFTVEQSAWILGVSTDRVYRAIRIGTIPAIRRHCQLRVPGTALALLLTETAVTAGHGPSGGAP